MKKLSKVKLGKKDSEALLKSVEHLEGRIEAWYQSLPPGLLPKLPVKKADLPEGIKVEHALYLHFAYNGSLIAIHSIFGYPWNSTRLWTDANANLGHKMESSTEVVVQASRNLILATRDINIDAAAPAW